MSFTTTREYPRHILQTLDLSSHSATSSTRLSSLPKKQERFKNVWDTSIHTFSGAFPRRYNSKHPPSVHHSLPDLSKGPLDLHKYDPETAKPKTGQEAQYNMISSSNGPQDSDKVPCMVAKRYVPKGGDGKGNGITIVSSHGLGACKELLEPLLARMVAKIHPHQVVIDEIWSFDQVGCGDTGLINSRGLGICKFGKLRERLLCIFSNLKTLAEYLTRVVSLAILFSSRREGHCKRSFVLRSSSLASLVVPSFQSSAFSTAFDRAIFHFEQSISQASFLARPQSRRAKRTSALCSRSWTLRRCRHDGPSCHPAGSHSQVL